MPSNLAQANAHQFTSITEVDVEFGVTYNIKARSAARPRAWVDYVGSWPIVVLVLISSSSPHSP
eukprot:4114010-Pyramimonas_sp.AAC.1